jgi:ornithine cyclodeaminase/alanine dehydrogenase-like protein (mu-crystallin family)
MRSALAVRIGDAMLASCRLFVESREPASQESGDVIAKGRIDAEIGEVLSGQRPGRENDQQITLFKSVGMAIEDLISARLVLEADAKG